MRWDNLQIGSEERRQLPGYRDPAAVRTFDAPEALDTRFYEVRAKSALNRVPPASRMPFRWTINPYRGCTHACQYCVCGDTPILMADGRTKAMRDVRVGDRVYGTERRGTYRHYVPTAVLVHWTVAKPGYRITLEDGRELIASADHRFLTARGWKYVIGTDHGRGQRPHLTLNDKLLGMSPFAVPPDHSQEYRRGYMCGLIRGDGHVSSKRYSRADGSSYDSHHFRLALTDTEALDRGRDWLADIGVPTHEFLFHTATATQREIRAIRTGARANVARIFDEIAWPDRPSDDWRLGFLAGIFDAEGSHLGVLRVANTDPAITDRVMASLYRFGFKFAIDARKGENPLMYVRLLGGLPEIMRFFHTTDPAITRKRTIDGIAIKTDAKLGVAAIEPLPGRRQLYDMTTGTGDFIANGVVSHNCFARPTHTYLDLNAGRDFEREIVVKVNAPEVVRAELARPSWKHEHVALGTNTDPYQWVEGRYELMRGIWTALRDSDTPCSVLTKSPLLLRDLDLMKEIHERAGFAANLSVPTLDEKAWRATEPHTPHPRKRLEAVAELNRAGIPCGVLIAPLMPGINDDPRQVERILELAAEAGATEIGGICLHLRGEVREVFMDWLRSQRPDLVSRYERLYARGAYAPRAERERLAALARPGSRVGPKPRLRVGDASLGNRDPTQEAEPLSPMPRKPRWPRQTSLF